MTAPLLPPDSGELLSTLARDWAVQVDIDATGTTPDWVFIRGLNQINPTIDPTMQDDSDLDSGGYGSMLATGQAFTIECAGVRKGLGATDFVADPGQEFLRAKGGQVGLANIAAVRWYRTDGLPDAYSGNVAVTWKDTGGGTTDLQGFTLTLTGRGKPNSIAKPTAV